MEQRKTAHSALSDETQGIVGSSQQRESTSHTVSEHVRPRWTPELCQDLYECYNLSEPDKKGYMKRLHLLWTELRPQYKQLTPQNLRDQVASLKKRGFQTALVTQQTEDAVASEIVVVDQDHTNTINENLRQRFLELIDAPYNSRKRVIHFKQRITTEKLKQLNALIEEFLPSNPNITDVCRLVYAAAAAATEKPRINDRLLKLKNRTKQLQDKLEQWRRRASQLESLLQYIVTGRAFTRKIRQIAFNIKRKHRTLSKNILLLFKEQAIDKIRSLVAAKKKLGTTIKRIQHNQKFTTKPSSLFQENKNDTEESLDINRIEEYWKELYEKQLSVNKDNECLTIFRKYCEKMAKETTMGHITAEDVRHALQNKPNYASPGPDAINTFWWKKFEITHQHLASIFNNMIDGSIDIPDWMCEGRTKLIYKKGDPKDPENYRPITCLNTVYKTFTTIIMSKVSEAIHPIWTDNYEQRGSKKGIAGVQENLLIDSCICKDAAVYQRNICMGWIDYKKAFDMSSHSLILMLLAQMKVSQKIINAIQRIMPLWATRIVLGCGRLEKMSRPIRFSRGVFQGDSLSPLLFCITMLPLSIALRKQAGYMAGIPGNRKEKISHLFYVDDLKLYASNEKDLNNMISLVHDFTKDVGMQLGTSKCAIAYYKKGKVAGEGQQLELADDSAIRRLGRDEYYTYLGVPQNKMSDISQIKTTMKERYYDKLRKIWSTQLNAANKCRAANMLAMPLLSHSFGCIRWTVDEILDLDRKTRKIMTKSRSLHPNSSVQRLYLPRKEGGRGLIRTEDLHNRIILSTAVKIYNAKDPLLKFVKQHELNGKGVFLFAAAERAAATYELNIKIKKKLSNQTQEFFNLPTADRRRKLATIVESHLKEGHIQKPMHGLYYKNIVKQQLDKKLTFSFLTSPALYSETEGYIIACQDGVFPSLVYKREVLGVSLVDVKCRACRKDPETMMHLLAACSKYAPTLYISRHNAALKVVYYHLRYVFGIDESSIPPFDDREIPPTSENEIAKIFWNFAFCTTIQIKANKPDMVVIHKPTKTMFVLEMTCPSENRISEKEIEKKTKYKDLIIQLQATYPELKIRFIPLVIGVLGGIKHSALENIEKLPIDKISSLQVVRNMQKYTILGSLRILRAHETSFPPT